ncbi:Protein TAPT1 homolog [Eumeta japonica]|uniref:Protein TAPT1 homolog n=1 Tax=Eumeta variegata TaxID=151549 RepID=A0A4C1Y6U3_EUMVA|nr:Protein TAPT1 homolog [Eumeta japonica]
MKEYLWLEERFWILAPDCVLVLGFEVVIDWVKHAFITRFNEIPYTVYREYTVSLAYDVAQTRQKYAFSDHSDLVARRMGFIPLPLGVVITRVLLQAIKIDGENKEQAVARETINTQKSLEPDNIVPTKPILKFDIPDDVGITEALVDSSVGAAAIFSNSAIDLNGVCYFNDKLNVQVKREPDDYLDTEVVDVSRSAPNIQAASNDTPPVVEPPETTDGEARIKRRSESEPNLATPDENYDDTI